MANGVSGDSFPFVAVGAYPTEDLILIELRTMSNLLQQQGPLLEDLNVTRNDQAFELGLPQPVPGTNM